MERNGSENGQCSSEVVDDTETSLDSFFNEIGKIGKFRADDLDIKFDATEIVLRLTSQKFQSPYQVLQLKHDANEEEIKKRYRKISLLIHPDKFNHEKSRDAFHVLQNAYSEIQNEDSKEKYKGVYDAAKATVYKRHKLKPSSTYLELIASGLLDSDLQRIENEIYAECEEILKKQQERREYAEKCIKANLEYERKAAAEQMEQDKAKLHEQLEWDKTRNIRVSSWRSFQDKVESKDIKLKTFKAVEVKREERSQRDWNASKQGGIAASQSTRQSKKKKISNAETSYKENWK